MKPPKSPPMRRIERDEEGFCLAWEVTMVMGTQATRVSLRPCADRLTCPGSSIQTSLSIGRNWSEGYEGSLTRKGSRAYWRRFRLSAIRPRPGSWTGGRALSEHPPWTLTPPRSSISTGGFLAVCRELATSWLLNPIVPESWRNLHSARGCERQVYLSQCRLPGNREPWFRCCCLKIGIRHG